MIGDLCREPLSLFQRVRKGLLEQDVLAGLERVDGHRHMQEVRRADAHRVHMIARQQFPVVAEDPGSVDVVLCLDLLRRVGIHIRKGDDPGIRVLLIPLDVPLPRPADSNDPDAYLVHAHLPSPFSAWLSFGCRFLPARHSSGVAGRSCSQTHTGFTAYVPSRIGSGGPMTLSGAGGVHRPYSFPRLPHPPEPKRSIPPSQSPHHDRREAGPGRMRGRMSRPPGVGANPVGYPDRPDGCFMVPSFGSRDSGFEEIGSGGASPHTAHSSDPGVLHGKDEDQPVRTRRA